MQYYSRGYAGVRLVKLPFNYDTFGETLARKIHTVIETTVARLFASFAQLLYEDPDRHKISKIDRKQRRQIDEKKQAQGMRIG